MWSYYLKVFFVLSFSIHLGNSESSLEKLQKIRKLIKNNDFDAYIILTNGPHQSEFPPEHFKRIQFLTNFTGSLAKAVITEKEALIWVDSRYYIQAEYEVDLTVWSVMRLESKGVPDIPIWLNFNLDNGSKIGYDSLAMPGLELEKLSSQLNKSFQLIGLEKNLVDLIWDDRPKPVSTPLEPLDISYTGKSIHEKITEIKAEMLAQKAEMMILPFLSDIAWILNLRGNDTTYTPVFLSYVVLTKDILYLFVNKSRISTQVEKHFYNEGLDYQLENYDDFLTILNEMVKNISGKILISNGISQGIIEHIPKQRMIKRRNFVADLKSVKNKIEAKHIHEAHLWDGLAIVRFFYWLEKNISNNFITEISAAKKLATLKSEYENFRGNAAETISSFGPHAAINHYSPTILTDVNITTENVYLLDSCGQYLYGTTDVSRTIHLGNPTEFQKKAFTLVLKGFINAASLDLTNSSIASVDKAARAPLKNENLTYGHGTGHGIGSYLEVHEYPPSIGSSLGKNVFFKENQFTSIEPGYYEEGDFGIRIENVFQVVRNNNLKLSFKPATLVPIQIKMIDKLLLSIEEIEYLNEYHSLIWSSFENLLFGEEKEWLRNETLPIFQD